MHASVADRFATYLMKELGRMSWIEKAARVVIALAALLSLSITAAEIVWREILRLAR